MSLDEVKATFFKMPRLAFVTLRGIKSNPRHQTIGWANDFCKRLADHWFVVREPDVIGHGYHFHALVSVKHEKLKADHFRKGVHTHIRYLSDHTQAVLTGQRRLCIPETSEDAMHYTYDKYSEKIFGISSADLSSEQKSQIDKILKAKQKFKSVENSVRKNSDIDRVLAYMVKTDPHTQYVDYILHVADLRRLSNHCKDPPDGGVVETLVEETPVPGRV